MLYQDLCWRFFEQSGHPDLYVQYRRQVIMEASAQRKFRGNKRRENF